MLDPFCGGGTTLADCQRRGLPSAGVDLNACLIARVKTAAQPPGSSESASFAADCARREPAAAVPAIPNLGHWFDRPIQRALASLAEAVGNAPTAYRDALRLALSSIVVRVFRQESDTRYAAVDKNVSGEDVFALFLRAAARLESVLAQRGYHGRKCSRATI